MNVTLRMLLRNAYNLPDFRMSGGPSWMDTDLVGTLSQYVERFIVDKTNLAGAFDFDLQWAPDQIPGGGRVSFPVAPFDPNGPSLLTALQEQLGLRLDAERGAFDVLVIDGAEKPSAD